MNWMYTDTNKGNKEVADPSSAGATKKGEEDKEDANVAWPPPLPYTLRCHTVQLQ